MIVLMLVINVLDTTVEMCSCIENRLIIKTIKDAEMLMVLQARK